LLKKNVNMLSGSIVRGLFSISVPIMIMNVIQSLFNIIDMTILKSYDTAGISVGAVGVCGTLITLITGLVIGVSTGANVTIARSIGKSDHAQKERAVHSAIAFSLVAGVVLLFIGISGAPFFLHLTNCPEVLLPMAVRYFRLYFLGIPILMVYNFCASILRASGDSRRPMIFLTLGGIVKVLLTYLLIAKFHLGVEGVALATIASWGVCAFLGLRALIHGDEVLRLSPSKIRFHREEFVQMLKIGVPAGLQQGLYSVANVIISATVNTFGPAATTGIAIANNWDGILYQICTATALAVMPYVSQNVGAGNVKRAMQSVWKGILITTGLGLFFGLISAGFSGPLSSIMSSDPEAIAFSQQKMLVISSTYFICGINDIFGAALRSMGKAMVATVATLIYMCALRFFWVYAVFPFFPSLGFLYLVWPVGWILSALTMLPIYLSTAKKLLKGSKHAAVKLA